MTSVKLSDGMTLLSGAVMNYETPDECNVLITDIAAGLSNVCRFTGQLPRFYSVAQHVVNCSLIVAPEFAFDALMHDTAEAFTSDLPTPLKTAFPIFKELEVRIETAMAKRFGFNYPLSPEIKVADLQMLGLEKIYIKGDTDHWPHLDGTNWDGLEHLVKLESWTPREAKQKFLARFAELGGYERVQAA